MHLSRILPISLSLVSITIAQQPPQPVVSINVGGQGNAAAGVGPSPIAQQPGQQSGQQPGQQPNVAGPQPAAITINPQGQGQGQGNIGQIGNGVPQAGQVPGQVPALGQQVGGTVPVWVVKVGSERNELVFSPNQFNAKPGEFIQFQFYSNNHSVVSSTFEQPCVPNTNIAPQRSFFSGFMPTNQQGQITYTVPVRDTDPIWFYCSQARHCQDGMVGVINPPQNGQQSLQQFQQNAQRAPDNITPNGAPAGAFGTQTIPGIAQATRSAATIVRKASWELAAAAFVVLAIL